jgi:hypothetical protein
MLEDVDVDVDVDVRWKMCGLDSIGSGQGPMAGPSEYSNEPSGSTQDGEFLD